MTSLKKPNLFFTLLSLMLIATGLMAAAGGYAVSLYLSPGVLDQPRQVMIERGQGVSGIAQALQGEGVISSALIFKAAARLTGKGASLKAGEYEFPPRISMAEAMTMLHDGRVVSRAVTVREGLTGHQVVRILNAVPELSGEIGHIPPEGSLLPETYSFIKGESRQGKILRMQDAMTRLLATLCNLETFNDAMVFEEIQSAPCGAPPLKTVADVLTLASIVEKETGVAEERRRIAGVFVNRLRRGIPLQTDPTVIYAITRGDVKDDGKGPLGRRLTLKDLQVDDPYNTYRNAGLPPGPIANPGRAAIEAVLNPEIHDYIYFVADGTGGHVFAKTLAEHNANVAKWRRIRKDQN
jgi:UPF0755 protein